MLIFNRKAVANAREVNQPAVNFSGDSSILRSASYLSLDFPFRVPFRVIRVFRGSVFFSFLLFRAFSVRFIAAKDQNTTTENTEQEEQEENGNHESHEKEHEKMSA